MGSITDIRFSGAPILLDGQLHNLKLDLNALAELEAAYGSITSAIADLNLGRMAAIRHFLRAGLLHEMPDLDLQAAGAWVNGANITDVTDAIQLALDGSLPVSPEAAEGGAPVDPT